MNISGYTCKCCQAILSNKAGLHTVYMYFSILTKGLDHSHVELLPLNNVLEFDPIELLRVSHRDLDESVREVDAILAG